MNKFICVICKDPGRGTDLFEKAKQWLVKESPFHISALDAYHYKNSGIIIVSAKSSTSAFTNLSYASANSDSALVFDGAPFYMAYDPSRDWHEQIRDQVMGRDPADVFASILGDFCLVRYEAGTITAFSDFIGACPIFYLEQDGVIAISNRQRLLQRVLNNGRIDMDPLAASWLTGQASVFGTCSPYRGVKLIRPGSGITVRDGKVEEVQFQRYYQHDHRSDDFSSADIREIVDNLFGQADAMARLPFDKMNGDLTGGMDSRAVMALVMGSALKSKIETFVTFDSAESAEVKVARQVAKAIGAPHEARIGPPPQQEPPASLWTKLRNAVAGTDATVVANAGATFVPKNSIVSVSGSGGEFMRPHVKSRRDITLTDLQQAEALFENYQVRNNPLTVQKDEISDWQKGEMRRHTRNYADLGVPFDDIHYVFYSEHRVPWWMGYTLANVMGRRRIFPLVNYHVARCVFSSSPVHKKHDRVHFEIMRHFDKKLISTPFLENQWHPDLAKLEPSLDFIKPKVPASAGISSPHWAVSLAQQDWKGIFDRLLAKNDSFIFDFIDRTRLEHRRNQKENFAHLQAQMLALMSLVSYRLLEDGDYPLMRQGLPVEKMATNEIVFDADQK